MKLDENYNKNKLYIIMIVGLLFFSCGNKFCIFSKDITINPNQFNFAQGKDNLEGITNASAILKVNNKTNLAKMIKILMLI